MRQLFFLLLFINSTSIATFSQFEYKIKICDGITNKPIPYATLMWGSINGIATDSSGTVLFKTLKKIDTFFVSSVGYIPSILLLDTVTLNNYTIVKLNRSFKQLEDVIIFTNPTTKAYSVTKEKPNSNLTSSIGNLLQTAILIKPSNAVEKLSSISFYAYDGSNKNAKIRLRLYKKNNDNTSIDIVNNNIIITNIIADSWNTIDLKEENIIISNNNEYYVALEWLLSNTNDIKFVLGVNYSKDKQVSYIRKSNGMWVPFDKIKSKNANFLIKVETEK